MTFIKDSAPPAPSPPSPTFVTPTKSASSQSLNLSSTLSTPPTSPLTSIAVPAIPLPYFVTGGVGGQLLLWNAQTNEIVFQTNAHKAMVR
jgi:WD40 repeat protein